MVGFSCVMFGFCFVKTRCAAQAFDISYSQSRHPPTQDGNNFSSICCLPIQKLRCPFCIKQTGRDTLAASLVAHAVDCRIIPSGHLQLSLWFPIWKAAIVWASSVCIRLDYFEKCLRPVGVRIFYRRAAWPNCRTLPTACRDLCYRPRRPMKSIREFFSVMREFRFCLYSFHMGHLLFDFAKTHWCYVLKLWWIIYFVDRRRYRRTNWTNWVWLTLLTWHKHPPFPYIHRPTL